MFFNTLTPKFYVALTGTSSLISGLILIFEWWYFKKYGTSFIEQVSLNYISSSSSSSSNNSSNSLTLDSASSTSTSTGASNGNTSLTASTDLALNTNNSTNGSDLSSSINKELLIGSGGCSATCGTSIPECKVWKNPMSLLRGAEYARLQEENGKEALTFYDMNLSAQDHQTFFTCEYDEGKPEYEVMQRAWRERNQATRISLANEALVKNSE